MGLCSFATHVPMGVDPGGSRGLQNDNRTQSKEWRTKMLQGPLS